MISVSEQVWARWHELEESGSPSITLLFVGGNSPDEALGALHRACGRAVAFLADEAADELEVAQNDVGEERQVGAWRTVLAPGGVAVEISEVDDFDALLRLIVGGLEQRGIEGAFDVFAPGKVSEPPLSAPMVECRLQVPGHALRASRTGVRSWSNADGLWRVVQAGAQWALENPAWSEASLTVRTTPPFGVEPGLGLERLMRDAIARNSYGWGFALATCSNERWRIAAVHPQLGEVSLIEAGDTVLQSDAWPSIMERFERFLSANMPISRTPSSSTGSRRSPRAEDALWLTIGPPAPVSRPRVAAGAPTRINTLPTRLPFSCLVPATPTAFPTGLTGRRPGSIKGTSSSNTSHLLAGLRPPLSRHEPPDPLTPQRVPKFSPRLARTTPRSSPLTNVSRETKPDGRCQESVGPLVTMTGNSSDDVKPNRSKSGRVRCATPFRDHGGVRSSKWCLSA